MQNSTGVKFDVHVIRRISLLENSSNITGSGLTTRCSGPPRGPLVFSVRRRRANPMTWALCLNCGETKFGALCPCPSCQAGSTGDINLDIAFSDHHMAVETIKEFGEVVRAISRVCDEDELRFWSFIYFVSSHHPDILHVELAPEEADRCAKVLERANPPPVVVREAERARLMRETEEKTDDA
jgi:hypothetical protein